MITLLKRLAILVALWLGVSLAAGVYLNARDPEMIESDVRAVLEPTLGTLDEMWQSALSSDSPEFEPLPADDVMRAETETTLTEIEALYDELIATHQRVAANHTDYWEKRWAGDRATFAEVDKERAIEAIRLAQRHVENPPKWFGDSATTPQAVSGRLDQARSTAEWHKAHVESELATAREQLPYAQGAPHQD